jgi:hypothetical protein
MRLWSLHPRYLDTKGLLAVWREGLLAKKVLQCKTKGYRKHPQLIRFKQAPGSIGAINAYLLGIYQEADKRGYCFNKQKIGSVRSKKKIPVTQDQLQYEIVHLLRKLMKRDIGKYLLLKRKKHPNPHPLFRVILGKIESWEKNGSRQGLLRG